MNTFEKDTYRYRAVEKHVQDMIDAGALGMGDKLPSLRSLSRDLRVSISTVSQAYVELEAKGIVESRPRSGFFVRRKNSQLPEPQAVSGTTSEPRPVTRSGLISTVLEAVGNKDAVALNVVEPTADLLPVREMSRIMAQVLRERPEDSLVYEIIPGNLELRRQIAFRSMETGTPAAADDMLITNGCLEALYISLRATTRPGDTVLIQAPTYYCFLQVVETLGLRVVEIPSHPDKGVVPKELANALRRFDVKACIFSPNFNNPDAGLTPEEAKREIVKMTASQGIPVIEDDVSTDLYFGSKRPGTLKQYDRDGLVILCSSFSKTLAPGWRVGWMMPGRFKKKALEIKSTTNVSNASPTQLAIAEFLRTGKMERQVKKLRGMVEKQMDTVLRHVEEFFPTEIRVTHPRGGGVLWVELPEKVDGVELFFAAREKGINIAPGSIFSTQDKFSHHIRLSCTTTWSENIRQGIITLGELAKDMAKG